MSQKRILVADDDLAILDAIKMILEDEGYLVQVVANGEAVLQLKNDLPDLILLDIWMSGRDGGEICQQLKAQSHTAQIPVIMVSANKDTADIARSVGAEDFIAKPFDIDELVSKVGLYA
jgi:DNA-binding response OmpR family regulator